MEEYKKFCLLCGGEMCFDSDAMASEAYGADENDDSVVYFAHCLNCGASYEIMECPPSEAHCYPEYQKTNV